MYDFAPVFTLLVSLFGYEGPKILSLGSDYFSATFYQTYFITNLQSIPPLLKHIFVTFLPSREKQINSLLMVSVGDTDK